MSKKTLAVLLVGVALTSCTLAESRSAKPGSQAPLELKQSNSVPPHSELADLVDELLPSVVNVRVTSFQTDPLTGESLRGQGSGVVITNDGIILTNNHVVEGAVEVTVVFNDDHKRMTGQVLGTDPDRDLAVIRVDADDLEPITIGRSSKARMGDDVLAIGFPLGLGGPTVTRGIISGLSRTIRVGGSDGETKVLAGLLQTDAAINPGNSGGALVDLNGHLIGINTAAGNAASAENLGFAINVDSAMPVVREIIETPPEQRSWMGVSLQEVDENLAFELGLPEGTRGAVIVGLVPGGPAEDAGIREGEVITAIDGREVETVDDVTSILADFQPEDGVEVHLVTSESDRDVTVTLDVRPPNL